MAASACPCGLSFEEARECCPPPRRICLAIRSDDETDRLCTGGQKYDSLQDPCSGAALLSSSVQQQNSRLRLQGTEPPNPTDRNATPVPRGRLAQRRGEMCELRPFPTREARRSETAASEGPTSGIVSPTA